MWNAFMFSPQVHARVYGVRCIYMFFSACDFWYDLNVAIIDCDPRYLVNRLNVEKPAQKLFISTFLNDQ